MFSGLKDCRSRVFICIVGRIDDLTQAVLPDAFMQEHQAVMARLGVFNGAVFAQTNDLQRTTIQL